MNSLLFCIKTCIPNKKSLITWGDYYLAKSLGEALERQGHKYVIQVMTEWYNDSDRDADVVIFMRGLTSYKVKPHHFNIMWNISHPNKITDQEYNSFDLVLIASNSYSKLMKSRLETNVESFLQFTDANMFYQDIREDLRTKVLFVGNSRRIFRPLVREAIESNLDITIYGQDWKKIIPEKKVHDWFPNDRLNQLYSSCDILLNDHWDDMRTNGFINNRFFDAAACGTIIINDDNPEIKEIFQKAIIHNTENASINRLVEKIYSNYNLYKIEASEIQNEVLTYHTADIRANQLLKLISRYYSRDMVVSRFLSKRTLINKVKEVVVSKTGYGKLYKTLYYPYRYMLKKYEQLEYFKSKFGISKTNKIDSKRKIICFLVSDNELTTTKGDFFSAKALGDQLSERYGYTILYLKRRNPYEWNNIPQNTICVISMLHDTDIRYINIPKTAKKIAWMRSYVEEWLENPCIHEYDGYLTTSTYWDEKIKQSLPLNKCLGILPLGVSQEIVNSRHLIKDRDIDVCFIGNILDYNRQIVRDLDLSSGIKFHFYGKLQNKENHPWSKYHKGEIEHSKIHEVYSRSKIVIEDTTSMTYNTINLRTYEAAACGAFIIANDTPGLKELLDNNVEIYQNKEELKEKINYLLKNPQLRHDKAEAARKIVLSKHTFGHRAEQFQNILTSKRWSE